MVIWETLAKLVLLLSVAFVLGVGARRLKQSAIIGYLLAGTILGPTLFDRQALSDWGCCSPSRLYLPRSARMSDPCERCS